MEIQEVDVYLQPDGSVKLEVRGVKGRKCLALTADIEKLLGGQIEKRELTFEHDEEEQALISESAEIKEGW